MSKEELLARLGLRDKLPDLPESERVEGVDAPEPAELSPSAMRLDKWTEGVGEQLAEQWTRETAETGQPEDYKGRELEIADCFSACFEPEPIRNESCIDPVRAEFLKTVMTTPDYQALHEHTALSDIASEIAAQIQENVFDYMDAPVKRVSAMDVPLPYAAEIELMALPSAQKVVDAVKEVL